MRPEEIWVQLIIVCEIYCAVSLKRALPRMSRGACMASPTQRGIVARAIIDRAGAPG